MIQLRDYQQDLVSRIRAAFPQSRRVLAVAPTGAGKTVLFSYITSAAALKQKRVYITVHRAEILDQISKALAAFNVPHGRIQPGAMPTLHKVQIGMVQTLARRVDRLPAPDLMVIDEAHHATSGAYETLINTWSGTSVLGVSATPARLDGFGLGAIFDVMVEGPTTASLIANGFLADFDYLAPKIQVDLSGVRVTAGDYAKSALSDAMDKPKITGSAVGHYRQYLNGRPSIVFCCSIGHAEHVAAEFNAAGFRAASIDGSMSAADRAARLNGLADGSLNVLTSCDLIGEGVDVPAVAGAILLRPTKSLSLHLQQVGRALRLKPDGSKAVILDHVGNVNHHGTPKTPREWTLHDKKVKQREPGIRQCKVCFMAFDAGEKYNCGSDEPSCLFTEKPAPIVREIEAVDGALNLITESPLWAGGASLIRASGDELKSLVARAKTREQLTEIARVRGYKAAWVWKIMSERRGHQKGAVA